MFCNFSPVAFHVFNFPIHWYSLAYIFGILFAFLLAMHLRKTIEQNFNKNMKGDIFKISSKDDLEEFLNYAVIGIVIGGRLGHVLFYDFDYYITSPAEIFKVWRGGMSFFGGFLGSITSAAIFCYYKKINFLHFADLWSVGVPIGLFFGRIANFINGELLGKESDIAWAVVFKDGLTRHPSQLYEAFGEGVLLFCLMLFFAYVKRVYAYKGGLSGIFCIGYGIARFICEFFREPDSLFSYELLINTGLNINQYMSIAIFALGAILLYIVNSKKHIKEH
ncbi:MAG: prolipoprotein diacylglyceryl transferase [Alphaproteobacteria bacterium]|nr:prolipoprotein diacylglyceryl transferase [Alphaproteobacteria bacterium]